MDILRTFSLKWAEKIPLFPLCMLEIFVCTITSSPCLREHLYTHTHNYCPRTLHADQYLTQYFWESLTGNVKIPMIGLKLPCLSSQPMSLSLKSNENIFSLVSYTMRRFSVSQTSAFCRRFIHTTPLKLVLLSIEIHLFLLKIQLLNSKCRPYAGQQMFYF